jgi:quinol monooxygenase YgiN
LQISHGKDGDIEESLRRPVALIRSEATTLAWFAIRFGRSEYGIFSAFPDDAEREAHLSGPVAQQLMRNSDDLLAEPPQVQQLDIVAHKLPQTAEHPTDTKALLLTFRAKHGNEEGVEQFLREAQAFVEAEPKTTAWFAIRGADGEYGIFDVFPNHEGRFRHLTGQVGRELARHALSLLGSLPDPELPSVIAEKL